MHAVLFRKSSTTPESYPRLTISIDNVQAKTNNIAKYRSLFDLPNDGTLPHLYLNNLVFKLHLALLSSKHFPYPALGLVLVRNESIQYRDIGNEEYLDITCTLERSTFVERGKEFDLLTKIYVSGTIIWESTTSLLYQCDTEPAKIVKRKTKPAPSVPVSNSSWNINRNSGRRYAMVTGDINPIHIHNFFARRFGFKRAVAHGMWTNGRALADLRCHVPKPPYRVTTVFHLPIYLGERVLFQYSLNENNISYEIKHTNNLLVYMSGSISPLE